MDLVLVMGAKDGKCYQKKITGDAGEFFVSKRIGDVVSGDKIGLSGYEFVITGGSDKAGFPMRKGIVSPRKRILTGRGVGFNGYDRNGKKQPGLVRRRTVCGDQVTKQIQQINLKVTKEGSEALVHEPATK